MLQPGGNCDQGSGERARLLLTSPGYLSIFSNMHNTPHTTSRLRARHPWQRRTRLHVGIVALLLVALLGGLAPASAQEDIEDARQQREDAREAELQAQAARDVLEAEWEDIESAFAAADELVRLAETRADALRTQLELADLRVRRIEVGIAWAEYDQEKISEQLADLAIQEYLGISTNESVLESGDINETLTRNTVLDVVQGAGNDVIDTARSAADRREELRSDAEHEIAEVQRLQAELEDELQSLEAAREVRSRARDALDARLDEWSEIIADWEGIEQDLTDFIVTEQRRIDAQSAFDAERSSVGFVWPTAGGIGSYFGWRTHPILGYSRLHGGLDIGGRMGQPIVATKEGLVIMARTNGGYGKTIIIDHGNGDASLYGHQSTLLVSEGDYVETGQHIGNVGSTGLSTGPHLHFEIRVNGDVVDPLGYLPPR